MPLVQALHHRFKEAIFGGLIHGLVAWVIFRIIPAQEKVSKTRIAGARKYPDGGRVLGQFVIVMEMKHLTDSILVSISVESTQNLEFCALAWNVRFHPVRNKIPSGADAVFILLLLVLGVAKGPVLSIEVSARLFRFTHAFIPFGPSTWINGVPVSMLQMVLVRTSRRIHPALAMPGGSYHGVNVNPVLERQLIVQPDGGGTLVLFPTAITLEPQC